MFCRKTQAQIPLFKVIYSFMLYFLKQKNKITAYSGEKNHIDAI